MTTIQYQVQTDFSQDEAAQVSGRSTLRTAQLDAELSGVETSITSLITALSMIQRDDGDLLDAVVLIQSLSSEVLALMGSAGFNVRGPWITATAYAVKDLVKSGTGTYVCITAHTSGVFATDLAADKWTPIFDSTAFTAGAIAFTPGGTIAAANVQAAIAEAAIEALQKSSNLADVASVPTARTNLSVPSVSDVQTGSMLFSRNFGATDALIGEYVPDITVLVDGMTLEIQVDAANTSQVPTFTPNTGTIAAKTIVPPGGGQLSAGDWLTNSRLFLSYNSTLDQWILLNKSTNLTSRERVGIKLALSQLAR